MANFTANSSAAAMLNVSSSRSNCSLTAAQNNSLNVLPLTLSFVIMACQLCNLIVFHFWRDKEPFIHLHVALAWTSLMSSAITCGIPLVRMLPRHEPVSVTLILISGRFYEFGTNLNLMILVAISVDRWLSVEYPIPYRDQISKRIVRRMIWMAWMVIILITVPGMILYFQSSDVRCDAPIREISSTGRSIWKVLTGPLILAFLMIFQGRIFVIAVKMKLRLIRAQRRTHAALRRPSQTMAGIVWGSLRASMVITLVSVVTQSPFMFDFYRYIRDPTLQRAFALLPAIQHMYSPIVYLLFFSQFRAVLRRGWGRLVRGTVLIISALSGVEPAAQSIPP
ncbi:hypothetical protein BV898_01009 [Hypsibius exemplaris]|uniref:G-protein coupled receptors family 1 profile domain-containing protein n=1 Tax=Hypsibius exemplaris TaxID=2072580 RepID=A0A1W0XD49_HYPEX|nr:hypothetical protein BV898_01009 [Hypsibius exemplaris]